MSTHKVEVVRLGPIAKHPNADTLGIAKVWGYTAIIRLGQYNEGDLVAYIEPDYILPDTEQFAFLGDNKRTKAKRLRGIWSQGLIVDAPEGSQEGDNVMEALGITRYEPPVKEFKPGQQLSDSIKPCSFLAQVPVYGLENLLRHPNIFEEGEMVHVSEKIHGSQARYSWRDGKMWVGSHRTWRDPNSSNWFTQVLKDQPQIEFWCSCNPGKILYGEIFGMQDLKYNASTNKLGFLAFDVMYEDMTFATPQELTDNWIDHQGMSPFTYEPFNMEKMVERSRENSRISPNQISEGIVIKPLKNRARLDLGINRVAMKLVSDKYLERAK